MDLSKIKDSKLIKFIYKIAQSDGGDNPDEIDKPKGFSELNKLLSKGFNGRNLTTDERDVIMGLSIDYRSNIGSNNVANDGDNVTVSIKFDYGVNKYELILPLYIQNSNGAILINSLVISDELDFDISGLDADEYLLILGNTDDNGNVYNAEAKAAMGEISAKDFNLLA